MIHPHMISEGGLQECIIRVCEHGGDEDHHDLHTRESVEIATLGRLPSGKAPLRTEGRDHVVGGWLWERGSHHARPLHRHYQHQRPTADYLTTEHLRTPQQGTHRDVCLQLIAIL
jgi:hypothetical protein